MPWQELEHRRCSRWQLLTQSLPCWDLTLGIEGKGLAEQPQKTNNIPIMVIDNTFMKKPPGRGNGLKEKHSEIQKVSY